MNWKTRINWGGYKSVGFCVVLLAVVTFCAMILLPLLDMIWNGWDMRP